MGRRKTSGLARFTRQFGRRDEGAVAVEFALVAFPFCALLLVIFETAIVLFTDVSLQNGVTAASRLIRTGQAQTQSMSLAAFRTLVCKNAVSYMDCTKIRIEVIKSATSTFTNPVDINTVDTDTDESWQPGLASEWVMVQARYDWKLFIPWISQLSNYTTGEDEQVRRLTAGTVFRNEPYGG
jgi:Flp pilus assembly protein TadG